MLKKILGSRVRINILNLFVLNPQGEYYVREISRLVKAPFDPARRELIHLESIGLLKSHFSGRQKYYAANVEYILYPEIKSMILKTIGIGDLIRNKLLNRGGIKTAFIYGSYAKGSENSGSDIDLFVIGDISSKNLQAVMSDIEGQIKREINSANYSLREFKEKYRNKNHFILSVLKEPKIFLKGDENELRRLVSGK